MKDDKKIPGKRDGNRNGRNEGNGKMVSAEEKMTKNRHFMRKSIL